MFSQAFVRRAAFAAGFISSLGVFSTHAALGAPDWVENFDSLNTSRWTREVTTAGGGNFEFQIYTDSDQNVFVKNSILYLKPGLAKDYVLTDGLIRKVLGACPVCL